MSKRSLKIEHSPLTCDYLCFWFDTFVDDVHHYVTYVDFIRSTWSVTPVESNTIILLKGEFSPSFTLAAENKILENIKSTVKTAIIENDGSLI